MLLVLSSTAYAKGESIGQNTGSQTGSQGTGSQTGNQGTSTQEQQQVITSPIPAGNQVQNQNQVTTQNQGEDSQLKVTTQNKESLGTNQGTGSQGTESLNRNETATENMSEVAEQVQELLQVKTKGGIGDQVRQVAQEQDKAQTQIQEQVSKLNSKGKIARFLTGTDRQAVKALKQQMEQNQLRIQQLEELQNQLTNEGDITQVQETIQLLTDQNTSLQDRVNMEEKSNGFFGWLIKLFEK
jgi:hypothetical protein